MAESRNWEEEVAETDAVKRMWLEMKSELPTAAERDACWITLNRVIDMLREYGLGHQALMSFFETKV